MNHTFIKCIVVLAMCNIFGSRLNDITYSIKKNGIMVNIDFTEPINDDDIIGWKSDRGWIYLTLLGVASSKEKIPQKVFKDGFKKIVIDDFDESTQIAILVKKPILGYDIINSEFSSSAVLFIHTEIIDTEVLAVKNYLKKNGESVFNASDESTFPKYNTSFKNAFNKARNELGPNSIFKFHGKLYTTNHPGEEKEIKSALIDKSEDFNIESVTDNKTNGIVKTVDFLGSIKSIEVELNSGEHIHVTESPHSPIRPNDSVKITANRFLCFNNFGKRLEGFP